MTQTAKSPSTAVAVCRLRVIAGWTSVAFPGAAIFNRIVSSVGNARAHAVPLVRRCRAKGSDPRDAVVPWLSVSCLSPVQRTEVVFNRGQRDRKRGHPVYRTPTP